MISGVALAVLQLVFALSWVIYVVYLPELAVDAGMARSAVPWLLLVDQAVFLVCDWAAGARADRVVAGFHRLAPRLAAVTAVSAAAFLSLPWIAPSGSAPLFVGLAVIWSATSSVLRAPPMVLFGRHASRPAQAFLAGAYLFGLGVAGAVAPWLGGQLADADPRIPFAMSAAAVVVVTLGLIVVERPPAAAPAPPAPTVAISSGRLATIALAIALLAIGFQVHFFMNTAPAYKRHLEDIDAVMPVFWLGFSVMALPASALVARFGGLLIMAAAAAVGAVVVLLGSQVDGLGPLIAAHAIAGMAWATVSSGAFAALSAVARPTGQGSALGLLFSMLAAGAAARMAVIATEVVQEPAMTQLLPVLPALAWGAAALVLVGIGWHGTRSSLS